MKIDQSEWLARVRVTAGELFAPTKKFLSRKDVKAVIDWVKEPVYAVLIMFAFTTILAQPFYVPSGSMEPTLAIGDAVFAAKFPYGYTRYSIPFVNGPTPPKRLFQHMPTVGDVVVFRLPRDTTVTFVKRVVGLPGDRLQMKDGRLWINGRELPLRADGVGENEMETGQDLMVPRYIETLPNGKEHPIFKRQWDGYADNTGVYVVPPGNVFMMGDNRDNSLDSRFSPEVGGVGYVPVGDLVGRAFLVIGSVDFKKASGLWEWPFLFRFSRIFNWIH
jgi:signal peptidase I